MKFGDIVKFVFTNKITNEEESAIGIILNVCSPNSYHIKNYKNEEAWDYIVYENRIQFTGVNIFDLKELNL